MKSKLHIKQQIERIIDEGSGRDRDVIVQFESPARAQQTATGNALGSSLSSRNMATGPSELLPPDARTFQEVQRMKKPSTRKGYTHSTAFAVARDKNQSPAFSNSLLTILTDGLSHHVAESVVKSVVDAGYERASASDRVPEPVELPTASSLSIVLPKDDLSRLTQSETEIVNIYSNRQLPAPRIAKPLSSGSKDDPAFAWGLRRCGALSGWGAFGARGEGAKVAVLDTGVDASHPDLQGAVAEWREFDRRGKMVPGSDPRDSGEHGTHVAGTIAGGDVSGCHIGVAPKADLYVGLVLDGEHGGTDAQVLAGMDWAIRRGVDVINMSLGGLLLGPVVTDVYQAQLINALNAGVLVVAAIGNDGAQMTGSPGNDIFALAVGATDKTDSVAGFSGGRTQVLEQSRYIDGKHLPIVYSKPDITAPGVDVYSSAPDGSWRTYSGTSMATPHVSGAAACLIGASEVIRNLQGRDRVSVLRDLLLGSAEHFGESGPDHRYGVGRLDLLSALDHAKRLGYI